jgi:hypothetical protein
MYSWNIGPVAYENALVRFADTVATTSSSN